MEATTKTNNSPLLSSSSSSSLRRQCPATTKAPSFYKPVPSLSTPLKIKPLSISIKSNPSYSVYNTLLPIVKNPKSKLKTTLIPSSPIPILRTTFIKALAAVTVFFAGYSRHKPLLAAALPPATSDLGNQIGYMESAKSIFTEMIKKSPLLSDAYYVLLHYTCPLDSYSELENTKYMIEERMNSEALKSANTQTFIGFMLMYAFYHEKTGSYKESIRIYDELVTKYPQDHRVYLCKGVLHTLLKEKEEADECFHKYMKLVPKDDPSKRGFDDYMNTAKAYFAQLENEVLIHY